MKHTSAHFISSMMLTLLSFCALADNSCQASVMSILESDERPEGVVFEIVNRDKNYLDWALPEAECLSVKLRDKFPALDIAIISHGTEQFALTRKQLNSNTALENTVMSLAGKKIHVHVCGTHAERKGFDVEDFSTLVDVAAEGPAQINDYIKLGYIRIRIEK